MAYSDIIIIGSAIIDIPAKPVDVSVFTAGSYPLDHISLTFGGDALNEAVILKKLGVNVSLVTKIGDDPAGQLILQHCQSLGIDTHMTSCKPGLDTGINLVLVDQQGERFFLTNPHGSLRKLCLEDIPVDCFPSARILCYASIFVHPLLSPEDLTAIFQAGQKKGYILCADMTKCKHGETAADIASPLSHLDYLFANKEEAAMVTRKNTLTEMADSFLACGVKNVIIKCGQDGCYIKNMDDTYILPAYPSKECVDTTGAGDSFAAGFLHALLKGCPIEQCGLYGNAAASLIIEHMGTSGGIQDPDQVAERFHYLKEHAVSRKYGF